MAAKSRSTAFLLCSFLGALGVHRFYLNKAGTGILMLLTAGGLMIWWAVDTVLTASGRMKDKAGDDLRIGPPNPDDPRARFWVRTAAISVDFLILQIVGCLLAVIVGVMLPLLGIASTRGVDDMMSAGTPGLNAIMSLAGGLGVLPLIVALLYFALQSASRHQATIGKRCFGLQVTTRDGQAPGLLRAIWRSACYLPSAIPLYLGFMIAGFTSNKRALHDYLAGTQVLYVHASEASEAASPRHRVTAAEPAPISAHAAATTALDADAPTAPAALMVAGAVLIALAAALALSG